MSDQDMTSPSGRLTDAEFDDLIQRDPLTALGILLDQAGAQVYVKEPSADDPSKCVHGNPIGPPCGECRERFLHRKEQP